MATIALMNVNTTTTANIAGATLLKGIGIIVLQKKDTITQEKSAGRDITVIGMATITTGVMWIAITIGDIAVLMVKVSF